MHGQATGKHGLTRFTTAKTWGKPPPSPLIVFSMPSHGTNTQTSFLSQDSQVGVPKFPKLGLPQLWGPITLCKDLRLRWGLKQSCSPCQELLKNMWHITCKQINRGDSWLLMIKSQIGNLTPGLSFGHNLCFKYQMNNASPFYASTFQELCNDIKNSSIQRVLTFVIAL